MNLLRPPVRFSGRRSFIRLTRSCWYTTTHQATQTLLKPIDNSPSASRRPRKILQINFLDHVIVGQGFFSFQEAGLL